MKLLPGKAWSTNPRVRIGRTGHVHLVVSESKVAGVTLLTLACGRKLAAGAATRLYLVDARRCPVCEAA